MRSEARRSLIAEFPELQDDAVLPKEVYAHFGLAFFKFALVEHSLINIFVFATVGEKFKKKQIRSKDAWEAAFDNAYAKAASLTFGNLARSATSLPDFAEISFEINEIKSIRDYFAHHFMREEAAYFESEEGCWFLLEKIAEVRLKTIAVEEELKNRFSVLCDRLGFQQPSEAQIQTGMSEYAQEFAQALANGNPKVGWDKNAL
jgi:hypothetical protein